MSVQENSPLGALNTLAIQAHARYRWDVTSVAEAQQAIAWARERNLPVLVLGSGSNLVLTRDWPGLVIRNAIAGFAGQPVAGGGVQVSLGGGENWHECVTRTIAAGWYGLENLALIPGTAGAAPVQNIGAYGIEISQLLESIDAVSLENGRIRRFAPAECGFAYRDSIFRQPGERWLITGIHLRLSTNAVPRTHYPALADYLENHGIDPAHVHPRQVMEAVIAIRQSKLPDPARLPNAGSFFKNPLVSAAQYDALKQRFPALVAYPVGVQWKLAAGWLIEQAGWRGVERDGVGTAASQALVLVNPGRRDGQAVMAFAAQIQQAVHERFGVSLEIEPIVV